MVKTFLEKKQILLISRIVLGGLFIYSGIDKIIDPLSFATIIHHYRITPPNMINFAAIVIPCVSDFQYKIKGLGFDHKSYAGIFYSCSGHNRVSRNQRRLRMFQHLHGG